MFDRLLRFVLYAMFYLFALGLIWACVNEVRIARSARAIPDTPAPLVAPACPGCGGCRR